MNSIKEAVSARALDIDDAATRVREGMACLNLSLTALEKDDLETVNAFIEDIICGLNVAAGILSTAADDINKAVKDLLTISKSA